MPEPVGTMLRPKGQGGIRFTGKETSREDRDVAAPLADAGIPHAEIALRTELREDEMASQIAGRKLLLPTLILANKRDTGESSEAIEAAFPKYQVMETSFFSEGQSVSIADALLYLLGLVLIHLVDKSDPGSDRTPRLVPSGTSVQEIAAQSVLQKDESLKSARVWGDSTPQPGQVVRLNHVLAQGDLVYWEI